MKIGDIGILTNLNPSKICSDEMLDKFVARFSGMPAQIIDIIEANEDFYLKNPCHPISGPYKMPFLIYQVSCVGKKPLIEKYQIIPITDPDQKQKTMTEEIINA